MQLTKTFAVAIAGLALLAPLLAQPPSPAVLQTLLDKGDFLEFARQLPTASSLTPKQQLYFNGTLAYRQAHFDEARQSLTAAVNTHDDSLTANQIAYALEALADIALRTYQYGASAQMYDDVDKAFGPQMGSERQFIREKRHLGAVLQHVPPQTVQVSGDFSLQRIAKEYPVTIAGNNFSAEFDTGAAFSLISETTARNWSVNLLPGTVKLYGYSGASYNASPGVIPVLQFGKAEFHNVVVFVTADPNLYIAEIKQQTNALLGAPVLSALGCLKYAKDGTLTVTARSTQPDPKQAASLWIGNSSLLVAVNTLPPNNSGRSTSTGSAAPRLFQLDTGSGSTFLTDHYLAEHANLFPGPPDSQARLAGAGGIQAIPAYAAHQLSLWFGSVEVKLNGEHILTKPQGGTAENYFGVIGQDLLKLFTTYTIDFRQMRFTVEP